MPNHITNYITITHADAKEIERLKSYFIEDCLDFEKILPMPEELAKTVSPVQVVETQSEVDEINKKHLESSIANERQTIRSITVKENKRRLKEYGANSWYDWSCNKWGTKWNSYSGRIIASDTNKIVCQFDTAWSPPDGIFKILEEQEFEINGLWKDEGSDEINTIGDGGDWYTTTEFNYGG